MGSVGTGALIVDVFLIVVALLALGVGYRQGGVSAFLSLLGVLVGGGVAVAVLPTAMNYMDDRGYENSGVRFLLSLLILAGFVVLGYAIGSGIGTRLRNLIPTRFLLKIDSLIGALIQVITVMIVVWLILVPAASTNNTGMGKAIGESRGLDALSQVMPEWVRNLPNKTSALINSSGLPVIMDPLERAPSREVDVPNPALQNSPVVQEAHQSVVKVIGQAQQCQRLLQGTGFVVAPNTIMTNAHVVAGTETVELDTTQGLVEARVTYYNPDNDIAILKTSNFDAPAIPWSNRVAEQGEDVIVLGYPMGGEYTASPARVRTRFTVSGPTIYADKRVEREAYSLRGQVVQGNSGGPLVDTEGRVLGLVFGADLNQEDTGYALTRKEVMSHVGDVRRWERNAETGACVLN